MLFHSTLHSCCSILLYTHVVPFYSTLMLFHSTLHSCCSILLYTHVVPFYSTLMLFHSTLHSCCSVLLYTHVVPFYSTLMLFRSTLHSCCSILLYTHVVPFYSTLMLFHSTLHSCCSILLYTHVVPFSTIGSFWMKEDWNITRLKIEPIFLVFSASPSYPRLGVCLENCKIWLTQHQQHKSFVVAYMAGSFSLWRLSLQPIPPFSRHFSERNIFASFNFFLFLYPTRTVTSKK